MKRAMFLLGIALLILEAVIWKATAAEPRTQTLEGPGTWVITADHAEKITPAYTIAPQEQASALAVPSPTAAKPVSVIVVTACNQIVALVAIDSEGTTHPLNIEGQGDARLKSIIARIAQRLVIDTGCATEPDRQPIF